MKWAASAYSVSAGSYHFDELGGARSPDATAGASLPNLPSRQLQEQVLQVRRAVQRPQVVTGPAPATGAGRSAGVNRLAADLTRAARAAGSRSRPAPRRPRRTSTIAFQGAGRSARGSLPSAISCRGSAPAGEHRRSASSMKWVVSKMEVPCPQQQLQALLHQVAGLRVRPVVGSSSKSGAGG